MTADAALFLLPRQSYSFYYSIRLFYSLFTTPLVLVSFLCTILHLCSHFNTTSTQLFLLLNMSMFVHFYYPVCIIFLLSDILYTWSLFIINTASILLSFFFNTASISRIFLLLRSQSCSLIFYNFTTVCLFVNPVLLYLSLNQLLLFFFSFLRSHVLSPRQAETDLWPRRQSINGHSNALSAFLTFLCLNLVNYRTLLSNVMRSVIKVVANISLLVF